MTTRFRRLTLAAAATVLLTVVWTVPTARASAQAFLDLFRVVNIAAVPVDVDRLNQLTRSGLDIPTLIGSQVEVLEEPGPALVYTSPAEAAKAAAIDLRLPTVLPPGLVIVRTELKGERAARVKADSRKLQDVLDALEIADLKAPTGLDGQTATIRVPPIVRAVYSNGKTEVSFFQARRPEVTLPTGIDLPPIAEIGLRIAGLGSTEAHTLAQAIDWRTTMLVPIPAGAATFRQVEIAGARGLFIESTTGRMQKAVLWSTGGGMYAITGGMTGQTLLQMAQSVQ
jgi:hypothetical protein